MSSGSQGGSPPPSLGCQTSVRRLSSGHGSPGAIRVVGHAVRLAGFILDLAAHTRVAWEATVMDLAASLREPLRQDGGSSWTWASPGARQSRPRRGPRGPHNRLSSRISVSPLVLPAYACALSPRKDNAPCRTLLTAGLFPETRPCEHAAQQRRVRRCDADAYATRECQLDT